jgi:hypothetical protein
MRKISAKMVPRMSIDEWKRRLHILSDLLHNAETFGRVITGDETWCFQYDPETKHQSTQWKTQNSCRLKKCFFDHKGTVHCKFIAQGQTVNQQCYFEVLTRLWESVRRKRPELWPDKWILYHDNAPAHDALRFCEFLALKFIIKIDHPSYSPDLAPCNSWFFPKLQNALKGQTFVDIPDIERNMTMLLQGIPENNFQDCFQQ